MSLTRPSISLFYDVASPYAWMAFEVCDRYAGLWDVDMHFRPFYLGGVMKATNNRPPGELPAKKKYLREDVARCARHFGVPLRYADTDKVLYTTITAQRLLTAAAMDAPESLRPLTRSLWLRIWSTSQDITTPASLTEACASAGIAPDAAASLLARTGDDDVKEALRFTTQEALDRGAFGAPSLIVKLPGGRPEGDLFWGCDRFDQIAALVKQPWLGPQPQSPLQPARAARL